MRRESATMQKPTKRISIGVFARTILQKPLYPYQELAGDTIIDSVVLSHRRTITIMCARQMGKNQLSAVVDAYFLFAYESGPRGKSPLTFTPQFLTFPL